MWACTNADLPKTDDLTTFTLSATTPDTKVGGLTDWNEGGNGLTKWGGETPLTKSSRSSDGTFYWTPGDQISLFREATTSTTPWLLTSTNTVPATTADFTGQVSTSLISNPTYWAIYPHSEENQFDGETITTTVQSYQTAKPGTFADGQFISIGRSTSFTMVFRHLCGGIKFTLDQPGITRIEIHGNNGEPLAGKVKVALDEQDIPYVQEVLDTVRTITLTCPGGFTPGEEYFLVTLPVQLEYGFTVEFSNGLTRTVSTALSINRSAFQWSNAALDSQFDEFPYDEFLIENAGTRNFIANVDYSDDPNYTRTEAYYGSPYYAKASDKPDPVILIWTGTAERVVVSTDPFFTDGFEFEATTSPRWILNLTPNITYYYRILAEGDELLKQGAFRPVGQVRWIDSFNTSNKTYNVRDLGGWKADGGRIAYGKMYRGAQLDDISDEGADFFVNVLGITVDVDLRGVFSYENYIGPVLPELTYYHCPVIWAFDSGSGKTQNLYKQALREIIGWLGDGEVIFFHCYGGADRTGTLAFLIEALLGVSESDLSKDYELTTFDHQHVRLRNSSSGEYQYPQLINYLRQEQFGYPETTSINELVFNWATNVTEDPADPDGAIPPLTAEEISLLRQYLIDRE